MIKATAHKLIDNFNYDEALEFIKQHGSASLADRMQGMHRSTFTEKKVINELERIAADAPDPLPVDKTPDQTISTNPEPTDQMAALKARRNQLVQERDNLKGSLELQPTDELRLKAALRIVEITREHLLVWDDINALEAGKPVIEDSQLSEIDQIFEGVTNPLALDKIRKNHVTYRSKARKGRRPADKIEFYEAVIKEAERRINELV